jgi:hypothetical protein
VPPGLGGAAHQLVITATQNLRDVAVSRTCLRAAALDPIGMRRSRAAIPAGLPPPPSPAPRPNPVTAAFPGTARTRPAQNDH